MKANKIAVLLLITGLLIGCTSTSTDAATEDTPEPQKKSQLNTREESQKSDSTMSILRDVYIILGRPAKYEITARVITSKQTSTYIEYGTQPGSYTKKTDKQPASRETPANFVLSGLSPETRYYYRIVYSASTDSLEKKTDEYSFITARISSSPYTFIIQSDSHLLNKADKPLYAKNMYEMKEFNPDFIFDLGDTFLNDKDSGTPFSVINDICFEQVPYLSIIAQTAPLFLVIGNHEGEYGFFLNNTKDNMIGNVFFLIILISPYSLLFFLVPLFVLFFF